MAAKKTDDRKSSPSRNRGGGILGNIGNMFRRRDGGGSSGGFSGGSDLDEKISFDISFDLGDIPPISIDEEPEAKQEEETPPFEKSLKQILSTLHAEKAKKEFVDFIRQNEVDHLTPFEIETLDNAFHQSVSAATAIMEKYAAISESDDLNRITQMLNDLKTNQSVPQSAKQEIVNNLLGRMKEKFKNTGPDTGTLNLLQNLALYSKRLDWEMQGENRIAGFTIKSLIREKNTSGRLERLAELGPYIRARIKDSKLRDVSGKLFRYLSEFYTQLSQREKKLGFKQGETRDELDDEFDFDFKDGALPEFGKEEEEFLSNLAKSDDPKDTASKIENVPEEKKADFVTHMGFDPRFDKHFEEIVAFLNKEDLGKLIGMIIKKTRDIEKTQGKNASEAYITDLMRRIVPRLGENHIIVAKVKSIFAYLKKSHMESAGKLEELRQRLEGKNPLAQIQILKDASEDPEYEPVFGAIKNLERLTVEKYFDEIFNGLPLETQEVIAQSLLSDLAALKEYYPHLIKKLENKLDQVSLLLRNKQYTPGSGDSELESRLCDYAGTIDNRSAAAAEPTGESNKKLDLLRELELEIDALPTLNEQIATLRFWVENKYYEDQPYIHQFLVNKLDFLEQAKAREGGLIRELFNQLEKIELIRDKVKYLEEKMNDPVYAHLRSLMQNLIDNIGQGISLVPEKISEEWILTQLKGIPEIGRKIEWLKIRQNLSPFREYSDLLNHYVTRYEEGRREEIEEKLEDTLYRKNAPEETGGAEPTIYKNIIALTRAVLANTDKVGRRKFIKEQERLLPLEQNNRFNAQRKMLYYLINADNDEKPSLKLKALADKVLLSFEEKREYLKLLKLSKFSSGGKDYSFQKELGLTDEDIAYYATYILGMSRPSLSARIRFLENFRNSTFELPPFTITDSEGVQHPVSYKDFFSISPPLITKVIEDLRKSVKETKVRQQNITTVHTVSTGSGGNLPSDGGHVLPDRKRDTGTPDSAGDDTIDDTDSNRTDDYQDSADTGEDTASETGTADDKTGLQTGEQEAGGSTEDRIDQLPDERTLSNIKTLSEAAKNRAKKSADRAIRNIEVLKKTATDKDSPDEEFSIDDAPPDGSDDTSIDMQEDEDIQPDPKEHAADLKTGDEVPVDDSGEKSARKKQLQDRPVLKSRHTDNTSETDERISGKTGNRTTVRSTDKPGDSPEEQTDSTGNETPDTETGKPADKPITRDKVYEEYKTAIDMQVLKQLQERGLDRSKASAQNMKAGTEKIVSAEKTPFSRRIAGLFEDLEKCFPDAVPDLINHTIIPIFVEKNNATGRDIFGAVNQNIFIPILHNGANVFIDTVLDSIESFLNQTGIFSESRKIIHRIADALKKCRSNEIDFEVTQRLTGETKTEEPAKVDPKDLLQILKTTAKIGQPDQFFKILNDHYIIPYRDNPDHEEILKKLNAVKNILNTDKSINWDKVRDFLGSEESSIIRQLKTKYGSIKSRIGDLPDTNNGNTPDGTKPDATGKERTIVPTALEHLLSGMSVFLDPHSLIMKASAKDPALAKQYGSGSDKARQYIIDTLYNSGKIFSYDRKHFIGFGKLAPFLYDRKNKGYNRPELTKQLLVFLEKFPTDKLKAEFLGIEEKELGHFIGMIGGSLKKTHAPADTDKKTDIAKKLSGKTHDDQSGDTHANDSGKQDARTHSDQTRTTEIRKKTAETKTTGHADDRRTTQRRQSAGHFPKEKERRTDDRRKIVREKKTESKHTPPPQKKKTPGQQKGLTARQENIIREAHKLVNDKLVELIKSYNSLENLQMLHKLYLNAHADKKNRLNLINRARHPAIYDVLKDDDAIWNHISLDMRKIMGLYEKKMKKLKK